MFFIVQIVPTLKVTRCSNDYTCANCSNLKVTHNALAPQVLRSLPLLQELELDGNPIALEHGYRQRIICALCALCTLDGGCLGSCLWLGSDWPSRDWPSHSLQHRARTALQRIWPWIYYENHGRASGFTVSSIWFRCVFIGGALSGYLWCSLFSLLPVSMKHLFFPAALLLSVTVLMPLLLPESKCSSLPFPFHVQK